MTEDLYAKIRTRPTEEDRMVRNTAGGHAFALGDRARLRRFLILGSDSPTYYASARDLTIENAEVVIRMAKAGDQALLDEILDVSLSGAAKKQNPTLFALAVACASPDIVLRTAALDQIPHVCRTFTMLADFLTYVQNQRGWGQGLMRAISAWYENMPVDKLAVQAVKYRQRNGWTHRDVLRKAHPSIPRDDLERRAVIEFMLHGRIANPDHALDGMAVESKAISTIASHLAAMYPDATPARIRDAQANADLPWEALPTAALNDPDLWRQMIPTMPIGALTRNLTRFTKNGTVGRTTGDSTARTIAERLTNQDNLKRARLHPFALLLALCHYRAEVGANATIVDALNDAFLLSFGFVQPTGGRTLLALDVSGSMDYPFTQPGRGQYDRSAVPGLTVREAAAAMLLVTAKAEQDYEVVAFTGGTANPLTGLPIGRHSTIAEIVATTRGLPFGRTDCALPARYALASRTKFDTIIIYTDNETWAGNIHPHVALKRYRGDISPNCKSIVVGMTATNFSIADPEDMQSIDVVGFDAGAASLIGDFARIPS